jgi:hypothetical protein
MGKFLGRSVHLWAYFIAGVCTACACWQSFVTIYKHLKYSKHLEMRNYYIRILLMVPIYAMEAYMGLTHKEYSVIWEMMRNFYEALVIFSFIQVLLTFLQGPIELALTLKRTEAPVAHIFPFTFLKPWDMGAEFVRKTVIGTLQYVACMLFYPLVVLVTFNIKAPEECKEEDFCEDNTLYGSGQFTPYRAWPWLAFMRNCSQVWALYCLVMFYKGTRHLLKPLSPIRKFTCIKAVVFFTFWQSMLIQLLVHLHVISASRLKLDTDEMTWTSAEIADGLQDFIICVEMLGFSLLHHYIFPHTDLTLVPGTSPIAKYMAARGKVPQNSPLPAKVPQNSPLPAGAVIDTRCERVDERVDAGEEQQAQTEVGNDEVPGDEVPLMMRVEERDTRVMRVEEPPDIAGGGAADGGEREDIAGRETKVAGDSGESGESGERGGDETLPDWSSHPAGWMQAAVQAPASVAKFVAPVGGAIQSAAQTAARAPSDMVEFVRPSIESAVQAQSEMLAEIRPTPGVLTGFLKGINFLDIVKDIHALGQLDANSDTASQKLLIN